MVLQLYNLNKEKIEGLTKYKDLKIESTLSTGDKVLSFSYPKKYSSNILEEGYLRTKTAEFVIKQINKTSDSWINVTASLNVEELENMIEDFDSTEQTIESCINLALVGTGWTVNVDSSITKRRTVRKTNSSIWDIIQQAKKTYIVEIEFDTINKIVIVKEQLGNDKGVYFTEELNLKSLGIQSNSYDFYTRILAIGKDDLKVEVENYSYSNKRKTLIWKDERYTYEDSLREDATLKLEELSKPYRAYSADVIDLANLNEKYKDILSYKLGDTITLISKENGIKEKQRIVKTMEYPDNPENNTVEIANTTLSFEDVQKEFQDTSDTVNNITEDNGTVSEEAIKVAVDKLTINKINVGELNAVLIRVGTLEATKANITDLTVINAQIENLKATKIEVTDLTATNIKFNVGSGGTLDLQTLLSKFVTGENGQFLNITSSNVVIANATIKDAMIENLSLNKLKAGTISTNKFNISSDNGGITIVGPTMQFKDKSNKVRIQMGQDTQGNFNFILRGEDGTTTLIDHTGIKEKAIADDLIKSNMVAENAIGEKQINYSSLITGLNKDTNTSLIQASKVAIDLTGQSLDVVFNSLKSSVDGINSNVESNTTSITAAQGKIDGLIKESSITKGDITTLKDNYTSIKATVDGISTTVASHTSSIGSINTNISGLSGKVTTVENKQATLEQNLNGFKTTVANTYSTKTELSNLSGTVSSINSRVSTAESSITQLNNKIDLKVESTEVNTIVNNAVNNVQIGGRNLLRNSSLEGITFPYSSTEYNWRTATVNPSSTLLRTRELIKDCPAFPQGIYGIKFVNTSTTNAILDIAQDGRVMEHNETYTLSAYFKVTKGTAKCRIQYGTSPYYNKMIVGSSEWVKHSFTFTYDATKFSKSTTTNIYFGIHGNSFEGYACGFRLEKGTKATDWTPAIEDVDSAISTVDTKIETTNNKVATIETSLSSITQRVSSTESNISTINGNVSSLQSRMSSAEQKLTDSSIINTVQTTINNAMNSAINSANSATDSKLQNYATKASMELTSTQLRLDFSSSGGYNIVRNGGFKNGLSGWGEGGYFPNGTNRGFFVVNDSSEWVLDGTYALCMKSTNNTTGEFRVDSQKFKVKRNTTYTLSYLVAAHRLDRMGHYVRGNEWEVLAHDAYRPKGGGKSIDDWTRITQTFNTGDNHQISINFFHSLTYQDSYSWITDVMINEGSVALPWSPHPDEIYSGSTMIDASGVTIYNGALNIKNKVGQTVLSGDGNGNLKLSIFNSVFEMSATGDRKTQMTCDVLDKFHIKVPFQNAGAGFKLETDTGKTLIEATAGTDYLSIPYYTRVSSLTVDSGANVAGNFAIKKTKMTHDSGGKFVMNIPFDLRNEGFLLKTSTNKNLIEITSGGDGALNIPTWTRLSSLSVTNEAYVAGNFSVGGSKNSLQETKSYGKRLINAYETAEYYFGDIGSGVINSDGECLIYIDDILQECINTECEYHVFAQIYKGNISKIERYENYFIVYGDKNTEFSWELKAKRLGYENVRLDTLEIQTFNEDSSIVEDILIEELDFKLEDILTEV